MAKMKNNFIVRAAFLFLVMAVSAIYVYLRLNHINFLPRIDPPQANEIAFFYLNLEKNKDRREFMEMQGAKYGIPLQRFAATDGRKIQIEDLNTGKVYTGNDLTINNLELHPQGTYGIKCPNSIGVNHDFIYNNALRFRRILTAGELGLLCTSLDIYDYIAAQPNINYAVIFEDDAEINPVFMAELNNVLSELPRNWTLVYFGFYSDAAFGATHNVNRRYWVNFAASGPLIRVFFPDSGLQGYMLNKKQVADLAVEIKQHAYLPIDHVFETLALGSAKNQNEYKFFATTTQLVRHAPFKSDIKSFGRVDDYKGANKDNSLKAQ